MKIKKSLILFMATTSLLFATDTSVKDLTDMQNFYYQKGYNDASEKFYKSGYQQAVFDMMKQTQKYRTLIDTYEAGKYYMQNNKITFPRVYRTRNDNGQYVIHIDTPEVKEKLSLEDIFVLPEIESVSQGSYNNNYNIGGNINNELQAIADNSPVNNVNYNYIAPATPSVIDEQPVTAPISIMKEFGIVFPKTERIKRILDAGSIKYVEMPDNYKAYFKNQNDFNTFCKNTSGDEQCNNLKLQQ